MAERSVVKGVSEAGQVRVQNPYRFFEALKALCIFRKLASGNVI